MRILSVLYFFFLFLSASAQDSIPSQRMDSMRLRVDSLKIDTSKHRDSARLASFATKAVNAKNDTAFFNFFKGPLMPKGNKALMQIAAERPVESKDEIFYTLLGLLAFLGLIRFFFPGYVQHTFLLLFQSSFRQKQNKDQMMQETIPSLLVNILFFAVTGLFITVSLDKLHASPFEFWTTFLYTSISLMIIYTGKFLFLLFVGWIFNASEPVRAYNFIVFIINRIIGIALLPLLLLLAFSGETLSNVIITVAASVVMLLFIYRYLSALTGVRSELRINALHFFIYLCAFEIAPLMVLFKLVSDQIRSGI